MIRVVFMYLLTYQLSDKEADRILWSAFFKYFKTCHSTPGAFTFIKKRKLGHGSTADILRDRSVCPSLY